MWAAITFSSFGDWLGLFANLALARQLTENQSGLAAGVAGAGVILVKLSPDLLFGPIAAAIADKFDRRKIVIIGDSAAGLLYASIALGYNLVWLYVAQFVIEAVGLFTQPAKQVIQTTIVPKRLLATANQISLFSVYGSVPVAAGVFAMLSAADRLAAGRGSVDVAIVIALLLNTVSFLISAGTVFVSRHLIPVVPDDRERGKSIFTLLREGVGFVRGQRVIKALYVGIIGAFAAGGLTVGVAPTWVRTLSAGDAGYAILFGTVFTGLAIGMLLGPKMLPGYTRSRVFALAIAAAGVSLLVMSLIGDFVLAVLFAALVGLLAGMAWIIGYTMIGQEVEDRLRGRVFAFVLSSVRLTLFLTIAAGPVLAGAFGDHTLRIGDDAHIRFSGSGLTLLLGGIVALGVGFYALRRATPSRLRVRDFVRRRIVSSGAARRGDHPGFLVTVDGADPAATARCTQQLADALRERGVTVVVTGDRGEDSVGSRVQDLLGAPGSSDLEPETAALLSAAGRAEHVATVVRPALEEGAAVVCDRYVLTSMALYGGGRGADVDRIRLSDQWATGGIRPDLTVVLASVPQAGSESSVRQAGNESFAPQAGNESFAPQAGNEESGFDPVGVEAVLRDAVDADHDRHVLVEPGTLGTGALDATPAGQEIARRLGRLIRARSLRLAVSPKEPAEPAGDPAEGGDPAVGGDIADDDPAASAR